MLSYNWNGTGKVYISSDPSSIQAVSPAGSDLIVTNELNSEKVSIAAGQTQILEITNILSSTETNLLKIEFQYTYTPFYLINCGGSGSGVSVVLIPTILTVQPVPTLNPMIILNKKLGLENGDNTNLTANLTANNNPLTDKTISFTVNGISAGSGTTDENGNVSVPYTITENAGTYSIDASFAGDNVYQSSVGSNILTVELILRKL